MPSLFPPVRLYRVSKFVPVFTIVPSPWPKYNVLKFRYYLYLKNRKKADLINKRGKLLARLLFDTSLDVIDDRWFNDDEKRRIKHAETLVPDLLPLGRVSGIFVSTREMVEAVNALIEACGLTGRIPSAVRKSWLFF